ncbi:MAG TPA: hypothetical protein VJ770_01075 [Stellaceae bacterium]|nr:hypothetical protein [Stellaceae bacterium]
MAINRIDPSNPFNTAMGLVLLFAVGAMPCFSPAADVKCLITALLQN